MNECTFLVPIFLLFNATAPMLQAQDVIPVPATPQTQAELQTQTELRPQPDLQPQPGLPPQPGLAPQPGLSSQPAPQQPAAPAGQLSTADEAARYLAGLPVSPGSPLASLTQDPRWVAHSKKMNDGFGTLERRQLSNVRIFNSEIVAPATQLSRNCIYFFSGPDFVYADATFSNCTTYVLVGLEPVDPLPDLLAVPPASLLATLQDIEVSLDTILNFSFFKTKDMRQDFQRAQLKGVLPIIFVFMARTGKSIQQVSYVSLSSGGGLSEGGKGGTRGIRITYVDQANGAQKRMYYFSADLSDDALRRNPGILRFCSAFTPANALLKAASYLPHENGFSISRNYLLQNASAILQDDSGIPVRYFTPDRWTLRFFGSYTGPIEIFKKYYQPDLRQYYEASAPKPLTFGFGYRWSSRASTLILAVRK